jgi:tetratricopeptide (TPR) repeat protein|tara:strand:+ start:18 stop:800 length:783 start_codon:yes stop_codon:yes gene_type:complete
MIKIVYLIFLLSISLGQNIDLYFSLIEQGKIDGVKENLPELISKYPKNPGVLYLKALLTQDGKSAIKQYKKLLKQYPNSKYAPDAAMKIGEYLYARGLYTQAATLLKNIPIKYSRFIGIQRATNLMINSFNAIGEADSARYYALIIKSMFPKIDTDISSLKKQNKPLAQVFDFNKKKLDLGPYVIQIGAFGSRENARRLKLQVTQLGHDVSINNVESNGKILYAVRVNRFKSKKQAENIGRDIKSKIGVEYRILYRPIGN